MLTLHIGQTTMRSDILLVSEASRQLVLLGLTVPWEEKMEEAHECKQAKYKELGEDCRKRGRKTRCMPVEIGMGGIFA